MSKGGSRLFREISWLHISAARWRSRQTPTCLFHSGLSNVNLEFEAIAADLAKPTREDFLDGTANFNYTQSPFWNVFSVLGQMMQLEEEAEGDQPYSQYFQMSKHTMEYLINILLGQVHLDTRL